MSSTHVLLVSMPWLLARIIVKYMDIISRVLAWHTTSNLIVTNGPCLLGHLVKKEKDSTYMQIRNSAIQKINLRELTCQYPSHIRPGTK